MAHQDIVDHYSGLARAALAGETMHDCSPGDFDAGRFGAASYDDLVDLPQGAMQASLGCGNPVAVAELHAGQTVLDLGSGGGIDALLSAKRVGPEGKVYCLDASADMLALARRNAEQAGATNVEFLHGSIEEIPLPDRCVDVVISNCVINLSSDKARVFAEVFRVLRFGGGLGISDVIADDETSPAHFADAAHRVGCVAGVLTNGEYRSMLTVAGLVDTTITLTADHGDGMHSAIIQAARPMAAD
ncbi:MAG: methyltransferase domain-containing protein [Carbonactinosporaceae bacterium]